MATSFNLKEISVLVFSLYALLTFQIKTFRDKRSYIYEPTIYQLFVLYICMEFEN
jgi:hypothetical protein